MARPFFLPGNRMIMQRTDFTVNIAKAQDTDSIYAARQLAVGAVTSRQLVSQVEKMVPKTA